MSEFTKASPVLIATRTIAAAVLAVTVIGGLAGCAGAEKATPVVAPSSTPAATNPDDYAQHMRQQGVPGKASNGVPPTTAPPASR